MQLSKNLTQKMLHQLQQFFTLSGYATMGLLSLCVRNVCVYICVYLSVSHTHFCASRMLYTAHKSMYDFCLQTLAVCHQPLGLLSSFPSLIQYHRKATFQRWFLAALIADTSLEGVPEWFFFPLGRQELLVQCCGNKDLVLYVLAPCFH